MSKKIQERKVRPMEPVPLVLPGYADSFTGPKGKESTSGVVNNDCFHSDSMDAVIESETSKYSSNTTGIQEVNSIDTSSHTSNESVAKGKHGAESSLSFSISSDGGTPTSKMAMSTHLSLASNAYVPIAVEKQRVNQYHTNGNFTGYPNTTRKINSFHHRKRTLANRYDGNDVTSLDSRLQQSEQDLDLTREQRGQNTLKSIENNRLHSKSEVDYTHTTRRAQIPVHKVIWMNSFRSPEINRLHASWDNYMAPHEMETHDAQSRSIQSTTRHFPNEQLYFAGHDTDPHARTQHGKSRNQRPKGTSFVKCTSSKERSLPDREGRARSGFRRPHFEMQSRGLAQQPPASLSGRHQTNTSRRQGKEQHKPRRQDRDHEALWATQAESVSKSRRGEASTSRSTMKHASRPAHKLQSADKLKKRCETDMIEYIERQFPELHQKTHLVPPVRFNVSKLAAHQGLPGVYEPDDTPQSNTRADECRERLLEMLTETQQNENVVIISGQTFEEYMNKLNQGAFPQTMFPTSGDLLPQYRRGEADIVIISKTHGMIIVDIKAVGDTFEQIEADDFKRIQLVKKVLEKLLTLIKKEKDVVLHLVSDILATIPVSVVLALPNLSKTLLKETLDANPSLRKELVKCLMVKQASLEDACLCAEDLPPKHHSPTDEVLTHFAHKWDTLFPAKEPVIDCEDYELLVGRFCGQFSTISVWSAQPPRKEIRTLDEAVHETGERFSTVILLPQQQEILKSSDSMVYLTGPPGSGKTLMLTLKGVQWAREGKYVCVLTPRAAASPIALVIKRQIQTTLEQYPEDKNMGSIDTDSFIKNTGGIQCWITLLAKRLKSRAGSKPICLILDELHVEIIRAVEVLRHKLDVHFFWTAGTWPTNCPLHFIAKELSVIVRCPPMVQRALKMTEPLNQLSNDLGRPGDHFKYVTSSTEIDGYPLPTAGVPMALMSHATHGDAPVLDCEKCAVALAQYLKRDLGLGKKDATLHPRDILILSADMSVLHNGLRSSAFVRSLRAQDFPLDVIEDYAGCQSALAFPKNKITVTSYIFVTGLERKVVVFLPAGTPSDNCKRASDTEHMHSLMHKPNADSPQDVEKHNPGDTMQNNAQEVKEDNMQDGRVGLTLDCGRQEAQNTRNNHVKKIRENTSSDATQDNIHSATQDNSRDFKYDNSQEMTQDVTQKKTQTDKSHDVKQDNAKNDILENCPLTNIRVTLDNTIFISKGKTQGIAQDIKQDKTQNNVQTGQRSNIQDATDNKAPAVTLENVQTLRRNTAHDVAQVDNTFDANDVNDQSNAVDINQLHDTKLNIKENSTHKTKHVFTNDGIADSMQVSQRHDALEVSRQNKETRERCLTPSRLTPTPHNDLQDQVSEASESDDDEYEGYESDESGIFIQNNSFDDDSETEHESPLDYDSPLHASNNLVKEKEETLKIVPSLERSTSRTDTDTDRGIFSDTTDTEQESNASKKQSMKNIDSDGSEQPGQESKLYSSPICSNKRVCKASEHGTSRREPGIMDDNSISATSTKQEDVGPEHTSPEKSPEYVGDGGSISNHLSQPREQNCHAGSNYNPLAHTAEQEVDAGLLCPPSKTSPEPSAKSSEQKYDSDSLHNLSSKEHNDSDTICNHAATSTEQEAALLRSISDNSTEQDPALICNSSEKSAEQENGNPVCKASAHSTKHNDNSCAESNCNTSDKSADRDDAVGLIYQPPDTSSQRREYGLDCNSSANSTKQNDTGPVPVQSFDSKLQSAMDTFNTDNKERLWLCASRSLSHVVVFHF